MLTVEIKQMDNIEIVWCMRFPIPVVFMISGAYLSDVELMSDWCQRATAGRCSALLLFQLRFNTFRWNHQNPM